MKNLQIQLTQAKNSFQNFSFTSSEPNVLSSFVRNFTVRTFFMAPIFLVQSALPSNMEQVQLSFLILVFAGIAQPEEFCRTSAQCSNSTYSVCGRAGRVL